MSFANSITLTGDLLVLNGGYRPPIDLAAATAGKRFRRLHIYGKPTNLDHLATLTHLVELRMQSTRLTDFALLAGMSRLEELVYGSGSLRTGDLSFASRTLSSLALSGHRSLTSLASVGQCTKLRRLFLHNLPAVREFFDLGTLDELELLDLRKLRHWPSLAGLGPSVQRLYLDGTRIDDGAWGPLVGLKHLVWVSALEDAFGKEAAAEFRRRRPDVVAPRRFPG